MSLAGVQVKSASRYPLGEAEAHHSMPHKYANILPSVAPAMRPRLRESVWHITPTRSVTSYPDGLFTHVLSKFIL